MSTKINGDTGIDRINDGAVLQADLAPGVAGTGPCFKANILMAGMYYPTSGPWLSGYSEIFDSDNCFDPVTGRFQPNVPGYYSFDASVLSGAGADAQANNIWVVFIYNGAAGGAVAMNWPENRPYSGVINSAIFYFNGTTDYLEAGFWMYNTQGVPVAVGDGGGSFSGFMVRRA